MPYVAGMSEDIRCICREFNIRVVIKCGRTLHSMLTKVKDTLPIGKQSNVVYRITCSCGQVYIGETRLKKHRHAYERGMMEKSVVAEHVWENHHLILDLFSVSPCPSPPLLVLELIPVPAPVLYSFLCPSSVPFHFPSFYPRPCSPVSVPVPVM